MITLFSKINRLIPIENHSLIKDEKYNKSIEKLKGMFFRECKRDGNCLYRAICFLIIPNLKKEEFKRSFLSFGELFEKVGFNSAVYDWYIESIE